MLEYCPSVMAGVAAIYVVLIVLATRYFGWMP